jgi:hypothetical protein
MKGGGMRPPIRVTLASSTVVAVAYACAPDMTTPVADHCSTMGTAAYAMSNVVAPGAGPFTAVTRVLPDSISGAASVVWHSGNGLVYASTNTGYIVELGGEMLDIRRIRRVRAGYLHQLTSDGTSLYLHYGRESHVLLKVRPSDFAILARSVDLGGTRSPEGFVFLNGSIYLAVGGPPGKIVRLDPARLTIIGEWALPGGIENHGLTTDGTNLFVLGVPARGTTPSKFFKVTPGFQLLGTITFAWNGTLGGNLFMPGMASIYTAPGRVARIDPASFTVLGSSSFSGTDGRLHWLAADNKWMYSLGYPAPSTIRLFNPATLEVLASQTSGTAMLHYGVVQNGFLWTASEQVPGVVQRWTLYDGGPVTMDVPAEADVYVDQLQPATALGTRATLAVGGGATKRNTYLRFRITGLPSTAVVTRAELVMWATNGSAVAGGGGTLRKFAPTSTTWSETTATWNTPPDGSDASGDLATVGPVVKGSRYSWGSLQSVVRRNGRITFVLRSTVEDGAAYHSRESVTGSQRPLLRVTYQP